MSNKYLSFLGTCALIAGTCLLSSSCNKVTASNQNSSIIKKQVSQKGSFSFKNLFSFSSKSALDLLNEQERNNLSKNYPKTFENLGKKTPLSTQDIIALTHITVEDTVLEILQGSKGLYNLDARKIVNLKDQGVSNLIIHRMMRKNKEEGNS
ncbi:hypothetical protein AB751O23_BB_00080 [Chlamydiales bacterium SCGC AB-751-O23]|jgi:hypothetical protein|nr:hypothetical protein AB751O23_BB_00080 [Chlamydiales bacterium SCGC AB-751-O23]